MKKSEFTLGTLVLYMVYAYGMGCLAAIVMLTAQLVTHGICDTGTLMASILMTAFGLVAYYRLKYLDMPVLSLRLLREVLC